MGVQSINTPTLGHEDPSGQLHPVIGEGKAETFSFSL